jgi:hypothetical protein
VICVLLLALTQSPAPRFAPVQPDLLGAGGALVTAWADYDRDGDADLFVGMNGTPNRLYRNDRGVLAEVASAAGVAEARATRAGAWGDFDGDGDPDLLVGFAPGHGPVLKLYRNDGGHFSDASSLLSVKPDSVAVRQPVFLDLDGDGDLDLFVAFRDRANMFLRNDAGHFTDVAGLMGLADPRKSVGAVWLDYDADGDLDLYVANMDGDANGLFRNDAGHFTDVAESAGVAWGGRTPHDTLNGTVRPCAADVNGDGRLDLFAANYGKNGLFLNQGDGTFRDASDAWGIAIDGRYDTCALADFDNDGRVDLYVNGTVTGGVSYPDYLFRNTGTRFDEVTPANVRALQADHGATWVDFDGDGDEDLSLAGARPDGMHLVLRNRSSPADAARSLAVRVLDAAGRATLAGAEVRLFRAGTSDLLGLGLVDSGSGYDAQSDVPVHVGLPRPGPVDVEVAFPQSGRRLVVRRGRVDPLEWRGRVLEIRVAR